MEYPKYLLRHFFISSSLAEKFKEKKEKTKREIRELEKRLERERRIYEDEKMRADYFRKILKFNKKRDSKKVI